MVDAALLAGRTVLITGASSGLGAHFAKSLARCGAAVALTARRADRLAQVCSEIREAGGQCSAHAMDVDAPDSVAAAFDASEQAWGVVHGLVNNAGMSREGLALAQSREDFEAVLRTNITGAFVCAQEFARRIIARGPDAAAQGRLVNIASITALKAAPGLSAYAASKAALVSLTKTWAREWARHGIAVNAICPGYIETDINSTWLASDGGQRMVQGFPRRRLLHAADLEAPLAMLLSAQARAITGSIITLDDGQSL
jgi:NAD(P)-dependent dehydrogenase (short-subunit alcohol dehydrogenase family)